MAPDLWVWSSGRAAEPQAWRLGLWPGTTLRPPQSFQYLTAAQSDTFFKMVQTQPNVESDSELYPLARVG